MKEIWKDVVGYEGFYQVSNLGNIARKQRLLTRPNGVTVNIKYKAIKPYCNNGYMQVVFNLRHLCKPRTYKVHRLVAIAFLELKKGKDYVNHINGIKSDNKISNLEWVTHSENIKHAYENNLIHIQTDIELYNSIFNKEQIKNIREEYKKSKRGFIARKAIEYNCHQSTIWKIVKHKTYRSV